MSMKYNEYDLLWLFEGEPIKGGDFGDYDGRLDYSIKKLSGVELKLFIDIYEETCSIYILVNGSNVFSADLNKVTSLIKNDNNLIISVNNEPFIILIFSRGLEVELISDEQKSIYTDIVSRHLNDI